MILYYDRKGEPLTLMQWAALTERDDDYRRVALTKMHGYSISTVWLGLNHCYDGGPPLIFETMVFDDSGAGRAGDGNMRYSTEEEALEGHRKAVEFLEASLGRQPALDL